MLDSLNSALPLDTYVPWAFLFASALLATCVDAFAKRPFNPVTVCIWFFGVTFGGSLGDWGLADHTAAVVCLIAPHLLISFIAPRLTPTATESTVPEPASDVEPPQRLIVVKKHPRTRERVPLRRAA
jgi:hypothetical protein